MNTNKHPVWKRMLSAILLAALLVTQAPAFAADSDAEPADTPTAASYLAQDGANDAGAGNDTPAEVSPQDGEETPAEEPASDDPQDGDASPGDGVQDGEPQEAELQTASTLDELLELIEAANPDDVIGLAGYIELQADTVLGDPDKRVTIRRIDTGEYTGFWKNREENPISIRVQNITFDGAEIEGCPSMFSMEGDAAFENVIFKNCFTPYGGAAITCRSGDFTFTSCEFYNNKASMGGHISTSSTNLVSLKNCILKDGFSRNHSGAISSGNGMLNIEDCLITGNSTNGRGGGISAVSGIVSVTRSKIYGNSAVDGGNDIYNEGTMPTIWLNDDLDTLKSLYDGDDLAPIGWCYELPDNPIELPFRGSDLPLMITMAFEEPEPPAEQEEPNQEQPQNPAQEEPQPGNQDQGQQENPTQGDPQQGQDQEQDTNTEPSGEPVQPTAEPTQEAQPTSPSAIPSYRHYGGGDTTPAVAAAKPQEEPKAAESITNGKAVLVAPDAAYWSGYKDSKGGGAGSVTRVDLALLLLSLMDAESRDALQTTNNPFADVVSGAWSSPAISTVYNAGLMLGYGNGDFGADRVLSWAELITVFARCTDGVDAPEVFTGQHWAKDAINTAIALNWIDYSEAFDPGGQVTCGAMIDFIQTVFQSFNE